MRTEQLDLFTSSSRSCCPATPLSDEDLMRFSRQNRPFKIERLKEGDLRIMTPMGGIGSTHERYVTRMLGNWTAETQTGIDFSPSVGFTLPDGACLLPTRPGSACRAGTPSLSKNKPVPASLPRLPD